MVSKAAQRKARLDQVRAEQRRRERRSRVIIFGVAIAAVATVVSLVVWAVVAAPSVSSSSTAISGLRTYTGLSRDHTTARVTYPQNPPVGGAHSAVWQNCGWYDAPIANENAVHSLEHSAVWVTYRPDLSAADRATLKSELDGRTYVLASPYAGLPGPVVASAWGKQVVLDGVSDPRLLQFVRAFAGSSTAPEPGGECTGGTGNPS